MGTLSPKAIGSKLFNLLVKCDTIYLLDLSFIFLVRRTRQLGI